MNILSASQAHLSEISMQIDDFAQFLIKLDRNKAPISPRKRNSPVWEIVSTTEATHSEDDVDILLYGDSSAVQHTMKIPYSRGSNYNTALSATSKYWTIAHSWDTGRALSFEEAPMPCAGKFKYLFAEVNTAPGVGKSFTFEIVNGSQSLIVTISDTNTQGSNVTNSVSFVAGDAAYLHTYGTGSPSTTGFRYCVGFFPTVVGEQPFLFQGGGDHNVSPEYGCITNTQGLPTSLEIENQTLVPIAGTFKKWYIHAASAIASASSVVYVLRKNGIDTALTVTLNAGETDASDLVNEVAFAAGDLVSYKVTTTGTEHTQTAHGILFCPTDTTKWICTHATGAEVLPNSTAYTYPDLGYLHQDCLWFTTETDTWAPFPGGITITGFSVYLNASPGVSQSRTFTIRQNQVDTLATVTLSGSDTIKTIDSLNISVENWDMINVRCEQSSAPNPSYATFGIIGEYPIGSGVSPAKWDGSIQWNGIYQWGNE